MMFDTGEEGLLERVLVRSFQAFLRWRGQRHRLALRRKGVVTQGRSCLRRRWSQRVTVVIGSSAHVFALRSWLHHCSLCTKPFLSLTYVRTHGLCVFSVKTELKTRLGLDTPGKDPPNKFAWAMYTPDGRKKIETIDDAMESRLVFIFKGERARSLRFGVGRLDT